MDKPFLFNNEKCEVQITACFSAATMCVCKHVRYVIRLTEY